MKHLGRLRYVLIFGSGGSCLALLLGLIVWMVTRSESKVPIELTRDQVARRLTPLLHQGTFPETLAFPKHHNARERVPMRVHYTIDPTLQIKAERLLGQYKPDYGAIVAVDTHSGAVLALASFIREAEFPTHLGLRADFPAASVFKIITAAAAIDQGKAYSETELSYNGSNHTLYKRNVESKEQNRWTRTVTLRDAFARSINTVFGKLGIFRVGADDLLGYAEKFHFNRDIPSDVRLEPSRVMLDPLDQWALAESASGFTKRTTLSPLHGALIAASIANEGRLSAPHLVRSIEDPQGHLVYRGHSQSLGQAIVPYSAQQMKLLMQETVQSGTSRKIFRGFETQDVGGKTGSLDGETFKGRTDWFVGYAGDQDRSISVGIVTVHKKYWTVKSAYLARVIFEEALRSDRALASSSTPR